MAAWSRGAARGVVALPAAAAAPRDAVTAACIRGAAPGLVALRAAAAPAAPRKRRRVRAIRGKDAALGLLLALALLTAAPAAALEAVSALSFYMEEDEGRLVLTGLPAAAEGEELRADVLAGERVLAHNAPVVQGRHPWVAFPLDSLPEGTTELTCRLRFDDGETVRAAAPVTRLPPRANAVQVDRLGGGLRVDGLPWFPFGFYCYWPVQPTLAGEEAVRGFNLLSPYQPNDPGSLGERIAYLDRAAALGMKVHYQLLDVSGGGGVYSGSGREIPPQQRDEWLRSEIEAVRNHPALLAWYIADEPGLRGVDPEAMQRLYDRVRELDPYHPVTMVFLNGGAARRFAAGMDLAMVDPYPVPNVPPATVGPGVAAALQGLGPRIPVWLVGQAFGGGEHWTREPTARELRLMTWLALVEGATGVQYFIRHGLSGFPKSPAAWAAAGRAAQEVQALTPYLLSREAQPAALSSEEAVRAAAWRHRGETVIAAVNTGNEPLAFELLLPGSETEAVEAEVLYEDRFVPLRKVSRPRGIRLLGRPLGMVTGLLRRGGGAPGARDLKLEDFIDAYGVRLYRLRGPAPAPLSVLNHIVDPSFEWDPSPSVPAAIYARVGEGRGATAFVDGRLAHHGRRSLRLVSPGPGQGVRVRPYAPTVVPARTYRLSVWARAPEGTAPVLRLWSHAGGDSADFRLTDRWTRYHLDATSGGTRRAPLDLGLATAGTAWLDLLEYQDISPRILTSATPAGHWISVESVVPEGQVHLRLDGGEATARDPVYAHPLTTRGPSQVRAALVDDGVVLARTGLDLHHHAALGRFVDLAHPHSPRYPAGGPDALTDGVLGSGFFDDGRWQGFEGVDLHAVVDLGEAVEVEAVACRFLQSTAAWIWLPRVMEVNLSDDGKTFRPFVTADHAVDDRARGPQVEELVARAPADRARFVRVRARAMGRCPSWHPGAGDPAWLFADEIRVNPDQGTR